MGFANLKELEIAQFAPFCYEAGEASMTEQIGSYLWSLLQQEGIDQGEGLILPPLPALGAFFGTSHLVVHDAFQSLRQLGLDYQLTGWDAKIRFWQARPHREPRLRYQG